MGLLKRKKTADDEAPVSAAARGTYDIDEHLLSPREVAERFGTQVDWQNIQGSRGLTSAQVGTLTWCR